VKEKQVMTKTIVSAKDAASQLGVHISTLRRYLTRGLVPGHKVGGNWRIPLEALYQLLEGKAVVK
jgi:excisionase family DNA binding protein